MAVYFLNPDDLDGVFRGPPAPAPGPRFGRPARDAVLLQWVLAAALVFAPTASLVLLFGKPAHIAGVLVYLGFLAAVEVVRFRRGRVGRFVRAVRGFRTLDRTALVVHYDPGVEPLDVATAVVTCERNLPALEAAFGVRLRYWRVRRPRVYLFRSMAGVAAVYGWPAGGYAEAGFGAVVLAADALGPELVRHEFAHLLAAKAARTWPVAVLAEGLAVWAQRTEDGFPVHHLAAGLVRDGGDPAGLLPETWDTRDWDRLFRYYTLAGSFTGYLIGRFGWPAYWRFYLGPMATAAAFRRRFRRHFGLTFEAARDDWLAKLRRRELTGTAGRESFEPS